MSFGRVPKLTKADIAALGANQGQRAEGREPGLAALPEGHGGERRIALAKQHREQGVMGVGGLSPVALAGRLRWRGGTRGAGLAGSRAFRQRAGESEALALLSVCTHRRGRYEDAWDYSQKALRSASAPSSGLSWACLLWLLRPQSQQT